jgi:hypothetical protein
MPLDKEIVNKKSLSIIEWMIPSHEPSCVTPAISKDMRITSKYMIDIKVELKVF